MTTSTTMTPEEGLKTSLANLFKSEEYSDFTIKCGAYEFKVHKAVICPQSEYFKAACKSNSFREGEASVITIDTSDLNDPTRDDPEAVKQLIHFFYFLDYEVEKIDSVDEEPHVRAKAPKNRRVGKSVSVPEAKPTMAPDNGNALAHAKVFAVAVKYHVAPLRAVAATKFKASVDANSAHPSFAEAIIVAYTTTPEDVKELRDIIAETLTTNKALLRRKDIEAAVNGVNGLVFALLRRMVDPPVACTRCGVSGTNFIDVAGGDLYCNKCYYGI